MINTYSESQLHHSLKLLYSLNQGDKVEFPVMGKICDIVKEDNSVVEIQTGSLSKLKN